MEYYNNLFALLKMLIGGKPTSSHRKFSEYMLKNTNSRENTLE